MARAMRGSAPWKPKATRVMRRILVLVDSISALDSPESRVASIAARCLTMRRCSSTKAGMRQRRAQLDPLVEGFFAGVALEREHDAESFFEQVGAPQPGIGLGDPVQLVALVVGEVLGVLPQRVAGSLERSGTLVRLARRPGRPRPSVARRRQRGPRSRPGGGPRRGRRWPRRRHGTRRRSGSRWGSARRPRWRSSRRRQR